MDCDERAFVVGISPPFSVRYQGILEARGRRVHRGCVSGQDEHSRCTGCVIVGYGVSVKGRVVAHLPVDQVDGGVGHLVGRG